MAAVVGFTGSRNLPGQWLPQVQALVNRAQASGKLVATGCANGLDQLVRQSAVGPIVFSVKEGCFGKGPVAYARRSQSMVSAVVGSGEGAWLVGFVTKPCPLGVVPCSAWRSGVVPSGTWSSVALAVGRGVPIFIVWCGSGVAELPVWGGTWSALTLAGVSGWRYTPPPRFMEVG